MWRWLTSAPGTSTVITVINPGLLFDVSRHAVPMYTTFHVPGKNNVPFTKTRYSFLLFYTY